MTDGTVDIRVRSLARRASASRIPSGDRSVQEVQTTAQVRDVVAIIEETS